MSLEEQPMDNVTRTIRSAHLLLILTLHTGITVTPRRVDLPSLGFSNLVLLKLTWVADLLNITTRQRKI